MPLGCSRCPIIVSVAYNLIGAVFCFQIAIKQSKYSSFETAILGRTSNDGLISITPPLLFIFVIVH